MKSQWFGDKSRYEFAKLIHGADHSMQMYDTFRGFLTCAFYSFRQAVHKLQTGEMNDVFEQEVIKEQKRVKRPENYAAALGVLTMALEREPYDFLGAFLSEMDMNDSKWKGQLFTPNPVAALMGQLTIGNKEPKQGETLWLNEPACGGGAMVIGASVVLQKNGFFPWHYFWTCVDVDWRCYAMAYIQLTLLGIPAVVVHGNTLSLQEYESAVTLVGALHPPKPRSVERVENVKIEKSKSRSRLMPISTQKKVETLEKKVKKLEDRVKELERVTEDMRKILNGLCNPSSSDDKIPF